MTVCLIRIQNWIFFIVWYYACLVVRVLLDGQVFSIQRQGGMPKVLSSIYKEFERDNKYKNLINFKLGLFVTNYPEYSNQSVRRVFKLHSKRKFAKLLLLMNWFSLWYYRYDVLHSTHYFKSYLFRRPNTKHVVTLHDMIPEDYPQYFSDGNPHFYKIRFLRNADVIVCVSNFTRSRLIFHYPEFESKSVVVYPGTDSIPVSKKSQLSKNILYVGQRNSYKDFNCLVQAVGRLKKANIEFTLLCVGGGPFTSEEKHLLSALDIEGVVNQKALSSSELHNAYANCLATVVTSRVEGFGLPVIEAMAHGAVVIATDIPVFKEIAGGFFVSFPSGDSKTLSVHLIDLFTNHEIYAKFKDVGYEYVQRFNWTSMYEEYAKIYLNLGRK